MPEECVFCHIANGRIPSKKVYEDEKVVAVLDINPAAPGHILLLTKEHIAIMPQMDDELVAHVGMVAKQLSSAVLRTLNVEGTSIFAANGLAAGQRAPHFMLHIIPRSADDGVSLQPAEVKLDEKQMRDVWGKLAPSIAKQFGQEIPEAKVESVPQKPKKSELDEITSFLAGGKK